MQISDYIGKTTIILMFLTINLAPALSPEIYSFPQISVVRTPCNNSCQSSALMCYSLHIQLSDSSNRYIKSSNNFNIDEMHPSLRVVNMLTSLHLFDPRTILSAVKRFFSTYTCLAFVVNFYLSSICCHIVSTTASSSFPRSN